MPSLFTSQAVPTVPWKSRHADEDYGARTDPNWRDVDWQAHLRQVEIAGARVNYVDIGEGDGTPVVLVHGLAGQWQNWLENIPHLAQNRRVLALDLFGHGGSEMPGEKITTPGYGRSVQAFVEQLGLGRVFLVGNSMGGFVACEVAIQAPEIVERLVLVSAAGISNANVYRAPALTIGRIAGTVAAATAARHRSLASRPVTRHLAIALVARHPGRLAPDLVWEGLMRGSGKEGFDDAFRACIEYDFRDRLGDISSPTLVVWGEEDAILSVRDAQEYERLIPDSRKVVMEDTGHVPMLERPNAFNELLSEFLAETGPAEEKEPVDHESQRV